MVTQKKAAVGSNKKRSVKKVIEHDPLSMAEEAPVDEDTQPPSEQALSKPEDLADEAESEGLLASKSCEDCINLGGSLVISEVEAWRTNLFTALQKGSDLVIDGGEIQQVDGAGMQLLAAFVLEAKRMHITFTWQGASPELCEASNQLGLTSLLQLNELCQAA